MLTALGYLVYLSYPALLIYPGWVLYRRFRERDYTPWLLRLSDHQQATARTVAGVLVMICLAFIIAVFISEYEVETEITLSAVILAAFVVGAGVHLVGMVAWRGRAASWMRIAGWLLMAGVVVVPSSLTIILPLIVPLMLLLHRVPEEPAAP